MDVRPELQSAHIASVESGIQQQLTQNVALSLSYVGNSNFHQSEGININTINPSDTADRMAVCGSVCGYTSIAANANLYRPYQGWGTIDDMEMGATSNYNSLQFSFRTMEWKGLEHCRNPTPGRTPSTLSMASFSPQ